MTFFQPIADKDKDLGWIRNMTHLCFHHWVHEEKIFVDDLNSDWVKTVVPERPYYQVNFTSFRLLLRILRQWYTC